MKKLILLLIFIPLFLITSLNFYNIESGDSEHPSYSRSFTCTSCHATIIDNIIISGGKYSEDDESIIIDITFPGEIEYTNIKLNIKEELESYYKEINPISIDKYGELYSFNINNKESNKQAKSISFEYEIPKDGLSKEIEVQGVLSNLDKKAIGDYSFYKKITLEKIETNKISKKITVFPTIANNIITIKNAKNSLKIYDFSSKLVLNKKHLKPTENIDVSNFPNGNYFISINDDKNMAQYKIIVQK